MKKEDKGDMDNDGVDEPDDKEFIDNKDAAIKKGVCETYANNKPVKEELKEENEVVESVVSKEKNKANESKNNEFSKSDKFYSPLVRSIAKKVNISLEQLDSIEKVIAKIKELIKK